MSAAFTQANGAEFSYEERARWFVGECLKHEYVISFEDAITVVSWWDLRDGTLLPQGKPGSGKTALLNTIRKVFDVPEESFYEVDCYKSIGAGEVLYVLNTDDTIRPRKVARALRDPHPDTILFFDDVDKIPADEGFEGVVNKVLEEDVLPVAETQERVRRAAGCGRLHTAITSNAGVAGASLVNHLSFALQRRCYLVELPTPSRETAEWLIGRLFPALRAQVIRDAIGFVELANRGERLNKEIAMSELKQWARMLDYMGVGELTPLVVERSVSRLAKNSDDRANLLRQAGTLIEILRRPQ